MDRFDGIVNKIAVDKPIMQSRLEDIVNSLDALPSNLGIEDEVAGGKIQSEVHKAISILERAVKMFPIPVTFQVVGVSGPRPVNFESESEMVRWLSQKGIKQRGDLHGYPKFDELSGPDPVGKTMMRYEYGNI